ncbi:MAG: DUF1844 domain-containing protein [Chloroflexi bacterium]|nr:DUF1844 domain-containing protein [Chloroflexota bacterium]
MPDENAPLFEIKDRRRFTAEGEAREEVEPAGQADAGAQLGAAPPSPPREPPAEPQPAASGQAARSYAEGGRGYEPPSFERLLLVYYQTALLQMGLLATDPQHPPERDLGGARETIDILGLLQDKTRGNLTPQESRVLDNLLYELRMAWVELSKKQ